MAFVPLLLASLVDDVLLLGVAGAGGDARRARTWELANRLGVTPQTGPLPSRLEGIQAQYGPQVLRAVCAVLRAQRISPMDEANLQAVAPLLPWVARALARGEATSSTQGWPRLQDALLWVRSTRTDLLAPSAPPFARLAGLVESWVSAMQDVVQTAFVEQVLDQDGEADRRAVLAGWLFAQAAAGHRSPWPDLRYLSDWVMADPEGPTTLKTVGVDGAVARATDWHFRGVSLRSDVWGEWTERVQAFRTEGWTPRPGTVLRAWPGGLRLEQLDASFAQLQDESRVMLHCVGDKEHGPLYWKKVQQGTSRIWSLRLPDGYPVVTVEWVVAKDLPVQIYGPRNTAVHPAYRTHIWDLISPVWSKLSPEVQLRWLPYLRRGHPDFRRVLESPSLATTWAKGEGPRDDTRRAASGDPNWALTYAKEVDKGAHPDTRTGACQGTARQAWIYALEVDRGPTRETLIAVLVQPGTHALTPGSIADKYIQRYLSISNEDLEKIILEHASPMTVVEWVHVDPNNRVSRRALDRALESPASALAWARLLGMEWYRPEETASALRVVALQSPLVALEWDRQIEKRATPEGRTAASEWPETAYAYWQDPALDKGVLQAETRAGILAGVDPGRVLRQSAGVLEIEGQDPFFTGLIASSPVMLLSLTLRDLHRDNLPPDPEFLDALLQVVRREKFISEGAVVAVLQTWPNLVDTLPDLWLSQATVLHRALVPSVLTLEAEMIRTRIIEHLRTDRRMRRRALGLGGDAIADVANLVDAYPQRDIWRALLKTPGETRHSTEAILKHTPLPFTEVPKAIRDLLHASSLSRIYGYWEVPAPSSRTDSDPLISLMNRVLYILVQGMAEILHRRFVHPRERALYVRAERRAIGALQAANRSVQDFAPFLVYARRVDPTFLDWLEEGFFGSREFSPGTAPLAATAEPVLQGLPEVFLPVRGRPTHMDGIVVPSLADPGGVRRRGGAHLPDVRGPLTTWLRGLSKTQVRYVNARLPVGDVVTHGENAEPRWDTLALCWVGRSLSDAELGGHSPVLELVDVRRTPLLTAFPWTTPEGAEGWMLVYPASTTGRECAIPVSARAGSSTRLWPGSGGL